MNFIKGLSIRLVLALIIAVSVSSFVAVASAQTVVVSGNRRVDTETITSYFHGTSPSDVNQGVKQLYATGLFSKVEAHREGNHIVVTVAENRRINRVVFQGNSKVKSKQLAAQLESRSHGPYNPATVDADIERIKDIYRHNGYAAASVQARTIPLPNGRVDVLFKIDEGGKTGVLSIKFVGNHAFSSSHLRDLMQTTEMNFLSWIKTSDIYDPGRLAKDEQRIRRFYLKHGYADFRIVGSDVTYDDGSHEKTSAAGRRWCWFWSCSGAFSYRKGYRIVITVDEGQQYRVSKVSVESHVPGVDPHSLRRLVRLSPGDVYNGDAVQKSVEDITSAVVRHGFAFASATPHAVRDPAHARIALDFTVDQGPRVYIERLNIHGNTRTRDYVIRRAFDIGEGDAYNKVLIDQAKRRLEALGYFKTVKITNSPGSAPDRVIVNVDVQDQPTGAFSISGGYSTTDGFIAEASVSESNFLGRGEYARLAATLGQYARGVQFNFTEPYFLGYRMAAGFDLFAKDSSNSPYQLYDDFVTGGTLRLGLPITDEITFSPHYSLYGTKISIPNNWRRPYDDCFYPIDGKTPGTPNNLIYPPPNYPSPLVNCLSNGEVSLALKAAAAQGAYLTSMVGYSTSYNSLDNPKNPHQGIYATLTQDFAGAGGDSKFVRTTGDLRYYHPLFFDNVVGIVHLQAGDIFGYGSQPLRVGDNFNLGPSLVRGFAPGGIGPRDLADPYNVNANSLGGTKYVGASAEVQFPIWGLPRDIGLKGAVFADAGTLFGYEGQTNFWNLVPSTWGASPTQCVPYLKDNPYKQNGYNSASNYGQGSCIDLQDSSAIRSSVGVGLLWASPLGPIRFNYAFVLTKAKGDVTQAFSFSGGSAF